jgi:homoserine/homoserine lactone efflux protein
MVPPEFYLAATAILILNPGPNVALIVANSVAHGTRFGLLTVAGTASGVVVQFALTVSAPVRRSISWPPASSRRAGWAAYLIWLAFGDQ